MLSLLDRSVASIDQRLVVLAPAAHVGTNTLENATFDSKLHRQLLQDVQRLRGSIYLREGAIQEHDLSPEGLHETLEDERSWHLVMRGHDGEISACAWYLEHQTPLTVGQLRARTCPLLQRPEWAGRIERAIELEMRQARVEHVGYCEVGGWATAKAGRCSPDGVLLILATFGLSRLFGGALGVATATARHASSAMLRRFGFSWIEVDGATVPAYFDSRYNCEMELLRFDTRRTSRRYERFIEALMQPLSRVPVFAASGSALSARNVAVEFAA